MDRISEVCDDFINKFGGDEDALLQNLVRETYLTQLHPRMLSNWHQGSLLNFLVHLTGAKNILEIGTFSGYATICMARALTDDGKITTIERNDEIEWLSKKYFNQTKLDQKIFAMTGDALTITPKLDEQFDFVFIDGDKREYLDYYQMIMSKTTENATIIADNVLWDTKIFKPVASNDYMTQGIIKFNDYVQKDHRVRKIILPLRDGLMILQKI
ncbi:MAG: O-methyltransferase [Bacteroidales bacterium]|nr:O-methyltransferase [Bacteroidales bacterium]MDD4218527.1 O-methyltransferase [Bacteroidales bacterium]MDY0143406.1 O-methyltransferase [Bacteroidales bacterium]